MLTGTIIKRAEYNYEEHVCFFNQRVKENLTHEELLKFPQYYYHRAGLTDDITSSDFLTNMIQQIYDIIKDISETNYQDFIFDDRLGICFNLDVKIHGYEDEDNHIVYDIIYAMSILFFKDQFDTRLYSHPIPLQTETISSLPICLWTGDLLQFRLHYIKWLSTQFRQLLQILKTSQ